MYQYKSKWSRDAMRFWSFIVVGTKAVSLLWPIHPGLALVHMGYGSPPYLLDLHPG